MTTDEQEALSRAHGRDAIVLIPLRSGNIAVYNAKRELCGIVEDWAEAQSVWRPPQDYRKTIVSLEELGLL